jgi:hypothetical protein
MKTLGPSNDKIPREEILTALTIAWLCEGDRKPSLIDALVDAVAAWWADK